MTNWTYYGWSNGLGFCFAVIFLIVCLKKYKNKPYKEKVKPLWFLTALFIILETIKIFYHISVKSEYPMQRYPFVFCSLVMYFYPLICLTDEKNALSRSARAISIVPSIVLGVGYMVAFSDATSASFYSFLMNLHSRFYHFAMFGAALYMVFTGLYKFEFKDCFFTGIVAGSYFILCTIVSIFMGGNLSYFGPTTAITKPLYDVFGYAVGNIVFAMIAFTASLFVYGAVYLIKKAITKLEKQLA